MRASSSVANARSRGPTAPARSTAALDVVPAGENDVGSDGEAMARMIASRKRPFITSVAGFAPFVITRRTGS